MFHYDRLLTSIYVLQILPLSHTTIPEREICHLDLRGSGIPIPENQKHFKIRFPFLLRGCKRLYLAYLRNRLSSFNNSEVQALFHLRAYQPFAPKVSHQLPNNE